MSLWLILRSGYLRAEHVGAVGTDDGVDIIARNDHSGRVTYFQCKNVREFGPGDAKQAILDIVSKRTAPLPEECVFIVSCNVSRQTREAATVVVGGRFKCSFWAGTELDEKIRRFPEIVHHFFESPVPPSGFRSMVPRPAVFVMRNEYEHLTTALLAAVQSPPSRTSIGITTAVRGAGGFGKTVLAQAVCWAPRIAECFPDGVLWTTVGEAPSQLDITSRLRDLLRWWLQQEPPAYETLEATVAALRTALCDYRVLLVVDDVWTASALQPFLTAAEDNVALVTTRVGSILPNRATPIRVDAMQAAEAADVLRLDLLDADDTVVRALAARLGEWPLLLRLVNRQLVHATQSGLAVEKALLQALADFEDLGPIAFDHTDETSRTNAVKRTVDASLQRLPTKLRHSFLALAVFPKNVAVPLGALTCLWDCSEHEARRACDSFDDLSLFSLYNRASATISLHDVMLDYITHESGDGAVALHNRLVANYSARAKGDFATGSDDGYYFKHLPHHLFAAGNADALRSLLFSYPWLMAKLLATDVNALISDYEYLGEDASGRQMIEMLLLAAPILGRQKDQLRNQLIGRHEKGLEPDVQALINQLQRSHSSVRLRFSSLIRPSSAVRRRLGGHTNSIWGIEHLASDRIVSSSWDGTLRVWDVARGECVAKCDAGSPVYAMATSESDKVALGCIDGVLRVVDVASAAIVDRLDCPHSSDQRL